MAYIGEMMLQYFIVNVNHYI